IVENKSELVLAQYVYDGMIDGNGRDRFTGAHECCHGLLHLPQIEQVLVDSKLPRLYRRQEIPRYRDPEWQADAWAGSFLMPTMAVQAFVSKYGVDLDGMSTAFNVSYTAVRTRIHYMRRAGLIT